MLHCDIVTPVSSNFLLKNWISARYRKVSGFFLSVKFKELPRCGRAMGNCKECEPKSDVIFRHIGANFNLGT